MLVSRRDGGGRPRRHVSQGGETPPGQPAGTPTFRVSYARNLDAGGGGTFTGYAAFSIKGGISAGGNIHLIRTAIRKSRAP